MFHYTKAVLRYGIPLLATYFFKLKRWAKHLENYPREQRFAKVRRIVGNISRALQADITVFGLENLPQDSNFYLVSNHMSAYDPIPFMMNYQKPLTFVGKSELLKAPFIPKAMEVVEGVFIDRENLRQSLKVMLQVEDDLKKGQKSWMIFPEGTRIRDKLLPVQTFHHGSFRPAMKAGVPIVPAAIYGTSRVLKQKPQFKTYPVFISFLKPIYPSDYAGLNTADVALMAQKSVQREITYHLRPLDHKTMSERKDKNYRFNSLF